MQVTPIKFSKFISSPKILKAKQMSISYFPHITPINQLCTNEWLVFYTRSLWRKQIEILSSCIAVFTHAEIFMAT